MKIGMIVPVRSFGETAAEVARSLGIEFCYREGEVGNALDAALRLIREHGAQAIIVRNPLNHILSSILNVPVLSLDITHMDIIRAVRRLPPEKSVGFLFVAEDEEKYNYGLEEIEAFSEHRVEMIPCPLCKQYSQVLSDSDFLTLAHYEKIVRCDAFVTATPSVYEWGLRLGKPVEYIGIDELALKNVMLNAINAVEIQARASQNAEFVEFALNSTNDGFLILQNGRVVMVNRNLCRWMEMDRTSLMNKSSIVLQRKNPFFRMISQVKKGDIVAYKGVNYAVYRRKLVDPLNLNSNWDYELISIINVPSIQQAESSIRRALSKRGFEAKFRFEDIVCRNGAMMETIRKARQYAVSNSNVLVLGESGTGKEMFAQSIHNASRFARGPFVAINCAALPENLLESELYGYEEGAFTGARKGGKAGLFELSHNGTLFLDEIGELPLRLQGKLLRSIQERCIYRVGGEEMIPITNRLICATNRDLWKNVERGEFREDLYYRINVLQVRIPPLRERKEDILPLARMLLNSRRKDAIPAAGELSDQVLEQMTSYHWPGNVRQLESFLERVVAVSIGGGMDAATFSQLFSELTEHSPTLPAVQDSGEGPGRLTLRRGSFEELERQILQDAYQSCGGCVQRVVELLGVSRSTVWRKLKAYQIV